MTDHVARAQRFEVTAPCGDCTLLCDLMKPGDPFANVAARITTSARLDGRQLPVHVVTGTWQCVIPLCDLDLKDHQILPAE